MKLRNILKQPYLWGLFFYAIAFILAIVLRPISQNYLNSVFNNALASYGVTRGFNALVSVMQDSSVSAGLVIEGNLAIGQILDPLNDLLERFSSLLLISLASVGIQKVLLTLSLPLSIFIAVLSFIFELIAKFLSPQWSKIMNKLSQRGFLIAIFLILFIPLMGSIGSLPLGLNNKYSSAQQIYEDTQINLESKYQGVNTKKGVLEGIFDRLDIRNILNDFKDKTELITNNIIDLIVVFIFQTVLLPIFTLFILWKFISIRQFFIFKE